MVKTFLFDLIIALGEFPRCLNLTKKYRILPKGMGSSESQCGAVFLEGCLVIFLTVGTQLPFDRLVRGMDEWAMQNLSVEIFGQIGPGSYRPSNFLANEFISPVEFNEAILKADLIVAHAGMGSILTALQYCKPIIIFPRRASLGEHRNEHQLATAKRFLNRSGLSVAFDISELHHLLDDYRSISAGSGISEYASPELISRIKSWIEEPSG